MTENVVLARGKRKREEWPENMRSDADVHETDGDGKWSSCKKCFRNGRRVVIASKRPYDPSRWVEHKDCATHQVKAANPSSVLVMQRFVIVGASPASASSSSAEGGTTAEPQTLSAVVDPIPPTTTKGCPGILSERSDYIGLFGQYGLRGDLEVRLGADGTNTIHAHGCSSNAVSRTTKRVPKDSCTSCFGYADGKSLRKRINRMSSIKEVLEILAKPTLSEDDEKALTNFVKISAGMKAVAATNQLLEQVKVARAFAAWCQQNKAEMQEWGMGTSNSPTSFLSQFAELYNSTAHFRNSILVGMVKAVIARSGGHFNSPWAENVFAFCQVLRAKSAKGYELIRSNLVGVSERQIQRGEAKNRKDCIIDEACIDDRLRNWSTRLVEASAAKALVSLSFDATKVPQREEASSSYKVVVGGAAPNHLLPFDMKRQPLQQSELASEVKCYIVTTQNAVSGVSPMTLIAAKPQVTNESDPAFNQRVVSAVEGCERVNLISVAADGLSAESEFMCEGLLSFCWGKANACTSLIQIT
eukprot:GHVU01194672.1.p1 GENE.GHVU01194672.1~~GHVU01194672.1.p1  ORF type:complete len:579 (-),score=57.81 GHVU01194672.1:2162-3751(-)